MFFGAGNLIFPPFLGYESGAMWPIGFICFLVADVVLACVGIYALNAAGGSIESIDNALGKIPGTLLGIVGVLCIGVIFAMPRTAATTYEMAIVPYMGHTIGLLPFSIVFFVIAFLLSMRESKIMDIIGRFFTPTLAAGVIVLIIAGLVNPIGDVGPAQTSFVVQDGIRAGYQTMDVLGVIAFSLILMDSIEVQGITDKKEKLRMVASSSAISVVLLAIVYGGLTYLGATAQSLTAFSQAQLLVSIAFRVLGDAGVIMLGVVVALACVTTAVALIGSTASYFQHLLKQKISYRALVAIICVLGFAICNIGLDSIVNLANPVLGVVCPPFVTLIVLFLFRKHIRANSVYKGAVALSIIGGLSIELHRYASLPIYLEWLPFYSHGFGWSLFALIGGLIGWAFSKACVRKMSPNA